MAVECYQIQFNSPNEQGWFFLLWRCRLVDGRHPRWEKVEQVKSSLFYYVLADHVRNRPDMAQNFVVNGGDPRITLYQIRTLFPETRTMPLKIALDYVRDRI